MDRHVPGRPRAPSADAVQLIPSNPYYRVGDVLDHCGVRWQSSAAVVNSSAFAGSLLHEYLQVSPSPLSGRPAAPTSRADPHAAPQATANSSGWRRCHSCWSYSRASCADYPLLERLLRARAAAAAELPGPDDVVVHVRAGDVTPHAPQLVRSVAQHEPIRGALVLVTAHAWQPCVCPPSGLPCCPRGVEQKFAFAPRQLERSRAALQQLIDALAANTSAARFRLVSHGAPERASAAELAAAIDADLVFMTAARHFVESSGGFSRLVARLVRRGGLHTTQ